MKIEKTLPIISRNLDDIDVPDVRVEVTAEEGERYGAFLETAMNEDDAWEANSVFVIDLNEGK